MKIFKESIKHFLNYIGYDLVKLHQIPEYTFMGLKKLPIKTIIDVGASFGNFAKEFLTTYPNAQIHCFEPLPEVYHELSRWTAKMNGQVTAYNVALGEAEDFVLMQYHVNHHYSSSLLNTTKYGERLYPRIEKQKSIIVRQTTLDNWMEQHNNLINSEIFIKLDVQGYEDRVIRGGINLFKRAKACLLEINLLNLYKGQASFRDIFFLLDNFGYCYSGNYSQECDNEGQVIYIDALFLKN